MTKKKIEKPEEIKATVDYIRWLARAAGEDPENLPEYCILKRFHEEQMRTAINNLTRDE